MNYISTRNKKIIKTPSEAILQGISEDGGLFVPEKLPKLNESIDKLIGKSYKDLAFTIMKYFFTDFTEDELKNCIDLAYDQKFDREEIVPVVKKDGVFFLELFHGPTLAFKDMALSILPHLLNTALKKLAIDKEILILTATSGDTGKAALEGFGNVDNIKIMVFYPQDGVSEIQKLQMLTHQGDNTCVVGIYGNFDDAQNGVKELFNDRNFNNELADINILLSSANSINIGRLVPQIVYYFYGYLNILETNEIRSGEKINIVVPTGNFGNILAAYYAKNMGLPVNKLICASNENNVLTDFFNTGIYDIRRDFKMTSSPSMDILISSNLERLLFEISNRKDELTKELVNNLKIDKKYSISPAMKENLKDFYGGFANEKKVEESIGQLFKTTDYLIDTHTSVAYSVYKDYREKLQDDTKTLIASTASPFKFGASVGRALGIEELEDDFEILYELAKLSHLEIPKNIQDLKNKDIIHNNICEKNEMQSMVVKFLS
ncbi:MAG TPA: threonine synthase [Eubacteriaceae bacterium]|nr:threonine synthase [Eubacteriaceae bacterium]